MNTSDVAEMLGLSSKTVRKLAREGFIPCRIIPGRKALYIWNREALERFVSCEGEQVPEHDEYEIRL